MFLQITLLYDVRKHFHTVHVTFKLLHTSYLFISLLD